MKPTDLLELNDDLQRESERLGEGGIAGFWSEWPLQPNNAQLYLKKLPK